MALLKVKYVFSTDWRELIDDNYPIKYVSLAKNSTKLVPSNFGAPTSPCVFFIFQWKLLKLCEQFVMMITKKQNLIFLNCSSWSMAQYQSIKCLEDIIKLYFSMFLDAKLISVMLVCLSLWMVRNSQSHYWFSCAFCSGYYAVTTKGSCIYADNTKNWSIFVSLSEICVQRILYNY